MRSEAGLTLIEVLMASVVASIGLAGEWPSYTGLSKGGISECWEPVLLPWRHRKSR